MFQLSFNTIKFGFAKTDTNKTVLCTYHFILFCFVLPLGQPQCSCKVIMIAEVHKLKPLKYYNTTILYVRPCPSLACSITCSRERSTSKLGIYCYSLAAIHALYRMQTKRNGTSRLTKTANELNGKCCFPKQNRTIVEMFFC